MAMTVRLHPITRLNAGKWADMKSKKWICEKCVKPCTVNVGAKMSQDAVNRLMRCTNGADWKPRPKKAKPEQQPEPIKRHLKIQITGKSDETGYKLQVLEQTHRGQDFNDNAMGGGEYCFDHQKVSLRSTEFPMYAKDDSDIILCVRGRQPEGDNRIIDIPNEETCNRIIAATVAYNHKHGTGDLGTMEIKVIGTTWTVG